MIETIVFDCPEPDDMTLAVEAIMREMQQARRWATVDECLSALHHVRSMADAYAVETQRLNPGPSDQDKHDVTKQALLVSKQAEDVCQAAEEVNRGAQDQVVRFNAVLEGIARTASAYLPDNGPKAFLDVNAIVSFALHSLDTKISELLTAASQTTEENESLRYALTVISTSPKSSKETLISFARQTLKKGKTTKPKDKDGKP